MSIFPPKERFKLMELETLSVTLKDLYMENHEWSILPLEVSDDDISLDLEEGQFLLLSNLAIPPCTQRKKSLPRFHHTHKRRKMMDMW